MEDTIVAISTASNVGAISIVRMSGKEALKIVNKIFKGKDLTKVKSHTINHGYIIDNDNIIDEVLVSIMLSPKTYTTEDVVEINTHGGISTTNKVLELCLANGARLAEPGEFTKRAFLNGRIDLTQAEATEDIITATTDKSLTMLMSSLTGNLKKLIINMRKKLVNVMASIEVNIDYPEYEDAIDITTSILKEQLIPLKAELINLKKESNNAKIIKDGLNIAIIGRPNVGKSSLLNQFLEEEKAIVTNVAGTTRDIVEGSIIYQGIKLNFIDTAGIHASNDIVEQIGIKKSKESINQADLIILVLNNNEELTNEDQELINILPAKPTIYFINKCDLSSNINIDNIKSNNIVYGNTLSHEGINNLLEEINRLFKLDKIETIDSTYLTNARQKALITLAEQSINHALENLEKEVPVDMIEIDIKQAYDYLGEIIGATYKDELLDELFSNFCLGK